jgi:hypothetical protein
MIGNDLQSVTQNFRDNQVLRDRDAKTINKTVTLMSLLP